MKQSSCQIFTLCLLGVGAISCHGGGGRSVAPTGSPYGLDARPANPGCVAPPRPGTGHAVGLQPALGAVAFHQPVLVLQAPLPGDRRFFVVEKAGAVRAWTPGGGVSTVVDISQRGSAATEMGLLGMAFHPAFATNHQVFLSYTGSGGPTHMQSVISRFQMSDGATLDPASETVLLTIDQPYTNHKGGNIAFGPDGFLYAGFGDGGSGGDPQGNGQNVNVLLGKMLRIDVDHGSPYAIPPTNPFAHGGGRPEIFAWGLRNPWRWSFDRVTGGLWVGDVGQNKYEEIDRVVLGANYGWNTREGFHCYPADPCDASGLTDPVVEYDHSQGIAVTGGFVYRGAALPTLAGTYVYGDYGSGKIWGLTQDGASGAWRSEVLIQGGHTISAFGEDRAGELYVVDYASGQIFGLVGAPAGDDGGLARTLSATGCVDPADATRPAPGLIPYEVNVPLWADGADKQRWMALPDGAQAHVAADGHLELPVGTVLMKTFSAAGRRLETRLFMRHSDGGWAGYSYQWNAAGSDADLLAAGKTVAADGLPAGWTYPSRDECLRCHTEAAGGSLGLEIAQLEREVAYPGGRTANQLDTLAHIGILDAVPGSRAPFAAVDDAAAPVESRARAYLQANCAFCHRPGGTGQGAADFRFSASLAGTHACNASPQEGDLGVAGARLLVPGDPARSLVSLRMRSLDGSARMPPLASHAVDVSAADLVDGWIRGLTGCE